MTEKQENRVISKFDNLCKAILRLKEEEFAVIEKLAQEQITHIEPFKRDMQAHLNETGAHNQRIVTAIKDLQKIIRDGAPK